VNFLAHCSLAADLALELHTKPPGLSGDDLLQGALAGAVIGDFIKGRVPEDWPRALQIGVRLHRKIDALSNQSEGMRQTSNRYPPHLRRFAPIFVDMLADHCLALDWHTYHQAPVSKFSTSCYTAIEQHQQHLSKTGAQFFGYMRDNDLLAQYHDWHHIRRGLSSVLRRLNKSSLLEEVVEVSWAIRSEARADFATYYPKLRADVTALDMPSLEPKH